MSTIFANKLKEFFEKTAMPKTVFASRIERSEQTVHNYLNKGMLPRGRDLAKRISKVTDNFIKMSDLGYEDQEETK